MTAARTCYQPASVLESHTHKSAVLSIPFSGDFLEVFDGHELHIDRSCALSKRPGFTHSNVIDARGFDGVLVEISSERHR